MWIPIDLRAPAWKGDPLRYSHHVYTSKGVLETLEPFPINIVAPIVLTGTLPVLILLKAVQMAAQCIS